MKIFRFVVFLLVLACFSANVNAQYIVVDDTKTAQVLVQNTLINSPCANVSNFVVTGGNFGSSANSYGYFSAGTSSFPFADGIVLSTSTAIATQGPNSGVLSYDAPSWTGDNDLNQALNINNTTNATILEFDFTPLTSKVSFDYIFASEEYHDTATCTYSDGFAFLLKVAGSTAAYQNLALVPNTTTPVKVTTVHPEIPNGCPAINEGFFDQFNPVNYPTNFNGQTKIMTATAIVIPGTVYHIKLVIADEQNYKYDSAIFLGGGSFKVGVDLGTDKIVANNNAICVGDIKILNATQATATSYKWFANGVQIANETSAIYQIIDNTNTNEVQYSVEVSLGTGSCIVKGEVKIQFAAKPVLNNVTITECDDDLDGKTKFNLTKLDTFIKNNSANSIPLTALNIVTYYLDPAATLPINNSNNFVNTTASQQIIYAQVANVFGCSSIAAITLRVSSNNSAQTFNLCDSDSDQNGITNIDFALQITPNLLPAIPATYLVKYYATTVDAIAQTNSLNNNYTNTTANQQVIYARIINGNDCFGIITITINILKFSGNDFKDETKYICPNSTVKLEVPAGFTYVWSNGNTTDNFINVATSGIYTVKITNTNNCTITKKFDVKNSDSAIINSIDVNDFNDNDNTILVNYSGISTYEFSIDGINFQDNSLFTNVAIGEYFVTIRDKFKCKDVISNKVYVLDFAKFFTPNGDGINDLWKINNLNKNAVIDIYDRFGKFLFQINANTNSWNGTYNEQLLQADDYWFTLTLDNNRIVKNHFALKR